MTRNFIRNLLRRIFQKSVLLKIQVLEEFDNNIFEYNHMKEQNISIRKTGRKCFQRFLSFLMLIIFERTIVENWVILDFVENVLLFQMSIFKNISVKLFQNLKFHWNSFLENFLIKFWLILYLIENFKDYSNHYLGLTQLFIFVDKFQK